MAISKKLQGFIRSDPRSKGAQYFCDDNLLFMPAFYSQQQAADMFVNLQHEMKWRQEQISIFGKKVYIPRLQAWHGDPESTYRYSGLDLIPEPWTATLKQILVDVNMVTGLTFNSVLGNWYRHGQDSMGWHSDDEKALGDKPVIASVSVGQERRFCLRHKSSGEKQTILLKSGSLIIMYGSLQENWQHSLPKSAKPMHGRINLTYRIIKHPVVPVSK
ncbi:alpha-ketoglutarate-dependent dioxygenase AlkB family protein [Thalassotalea mangrovi]|uniref:Alpha-ketoglutarate-dependent dioxygenase AlkB n=1 Tax=Thalassotalea mangrovi TaxID=2572245 RepID=A0A4U1B516_9GAMM|nr:alpha-ketoglutarate-dependent dioxygenase AlkB [Thalassotalea mangrovi]TKB44628.1 alpha-ketoglutarate-dependent dioxygenase AlkB [Thalassotalea mangrovi]